MDMKVYLYRGRQVGGGDGGQTSRKRTQQRKEAGRRMRKGGVEKTATRSGVELTKGKKRRAGYRRKE